jgi:hypothetical protein
MELVFSQVADKTRLFTISQKRKKSLHYIATTFGFEIYHRSKRFYLLALVT